MNRVPCEPWGAAHLRKRGGRRLSAHGHLERPSRNCVHGAGCGLRGLAALTYFDTEIRAPKEVPLLGLLSGCALAFSLRSLCGAQFGGNFPDDLKRLPGKFYRL